MHILENECLSVAIADQGAQLSRVWDKEAGCERLWSANPAVWNRHAPILFPFVGNVSGKQYRYKGRTYEMKTQHGFARDLNFICQEEGNACISHVLSSTQETKRIYPFDFRLTVRHRLDASNPRLLHVEWEVTNTGDGEMYYAIGGHPGFMPPANVSKEDCFLGFPGKEKLHYISVSPAGLALADQVHELTLNGSHVPYSETLPQTWIFEGHQVPAVQILRPEGSPWVTLHCETFPMLAVWAKAEGPFICLEPWYGRTDNEGFTGEITEKAGEERLAPGQSKQISYSIEFHH